MTMTTKNTESQEGGAVSSLSSSDIVGIWMPIETAPRNGESRIMIAEIYEGKIRDIDFDAIFEKEQESWEMPEVYWVWKSADGRVEEPTHWAYLPSLPNSVEQAPRDSGVA